MNTWGAPAFDTLAFDTAAKRSAQNVLEDSVLS